MCRRFVTSCARWSRVDRAVQPRVAADSLRSPLNAISLTGKPKEPDIARVEQSLGVTLPAEYRAALLSAGPPSTDEPEFYRDVDHLVGANDHFTLNPSDLSSYGRLWLTGLKLKLFPSARRRLSERLAAHKQEWAGAQRFFIGSDLGEEQYFIVLREAPTRVYRFQLEGGRIDVVAGSMAEWLAQVRRRAAEVAAEK